MSKLEGIIFDNLFLYAIVTIIKGQIPSHSSPFSQTVLVVSFVFSNSSMLLLFQL
uniref:Uncharacterized protein n=1 Tax=Oryza brachyantha TaxID=4533 RepID=J3M488_ORYBR